MRLEVLLNTQNACLRCSSRHTFCGKRKAPGKGAFLVERRVRDQGLTPTAEFLSAKAIGVTVGAAAPTSSKIESALVVAVGAVLLPIQTLPEGSMAMLEPLPRPVCEKPSGVVAGETGVGESTAPLGLNSETVSYTHLDVYKRQL